MVRKFDRRYPGTAGSSFIPPTDDDAPLPASSRISASKDREICDKITIKLRMFPLAIFILSILYFFSKFDVTLAIIIFEIFFFFNHTSVCGKNMMIRIIERQDNNNHQRYG